MDTKANEIWLRETSDFKEFMLVDMYGEKFVCIAKGGVVQDADLPEDQARKLNITSDQLFNALLLLEENGTL